jgi:hypothetical protein
VRIKVYAQVRSVSASGCAADHLISPGQRYRCTGRTRGETSIFQDLTKAKLLYDLIYDLVQDDVGCCIRLGVCTVLGCIAHLRRGLPCGKLGR